MNETPAPLRILALSHNPATDFRLVTSLRALKTYTQVEYALVTLMPWNVVELRATLRDIRQWDVIWLSRPRQYILLPIIREARRCGKPVLIDVDDWLLDVPADHPDALFYRTRSRRELIRTALRAADAITTSTAVIAERCAALGARAHIVSNAIDYQQYTRYPRSEGLTTIAFCGSLSHHSDIPIIGAPLRQLLNDRSSDVHVVSVSCPIPSLQGLNGYTHLDSVAAAEYPQLLSDLRIDIGLAPLQDSFFNQAKSDIKYLEYTAAGAATIASATVPYRVSIRDDRGILVPSNTSEAWLIAIRRLVEDTPLRQRLACNAYEWVRRERSLEVMAHAWYSVFRQYADGRGPRVVPGKRQLDPGRFERVLANIALRELPYDAQQFRRVLGLQARARIRKWWS